MWNNCLRPYTALSCQEFPHVTFSCVHGVGSDLHTPQKPEWLTASSSLQRWPVLDAVSQWWLLYWNTMLDQLRLWADIDRNCNTFFMFLASAATIKIILISQLFHAFGVKGLRTPWFSLLVWLLRWTRRDVFVCEKSFTKNAKKPALFHTYVACHRGLCPVGPK